MVEPYNDRTLREIFIHDQRVVYHYDGVVVSIITVVHGSHLLKPSDLFGE